MDIKLSPRVSLQNSLQLARISDRNTWWEEKPQLSYRLLRNPLTFLRAEYEYLTYNHPRVDYWTPHHRHVVSPVFDTSLPLGKGIQITVDARAPYVFSQSKFGYQVAGGPTIDLFGRAQLKGSYIYSRIPGDQGAWSGHGWQASFQVPF